MTRRMRSCCSESPAPRARLGDGASTSGAHRAPRVAIAFDSAPRGQLSAAARQPHRGLRDRATACRHAPHDPARAGGRSARRRGTGSPARRTSRRSGSTTRGHRNSSRTAAIALARAAPYASASSSSDSSASDPAVDVPRRHRGRGRAARRGRRASRRAVVTTGSPAQKQSSRRVRNAKRLSRSSKCAETPRSASSEVGAAPLVRDPALVEEDDAIAQPEFLGARDRARRHRASPARAGSGDGARGRRAARRRGVRASSATASITRQRVEPVPDPAAARAAHGRSRRSRARRPSAPRCSAAAAPWIDAERNDVDQAAKRWVAREALVVDASRLQQRAEPEVALPSRSRRRTRRRCARRRLLRAGSAARASAGCRSVALAARRARGSRCAAAHRGRRCAARPRPRELRASSARAGAARRRQSAPAVSGVITRGIPNVRDDELEAVSARDPSRTERRASRRPRCAARGRSSGSGCPGRPCSSRRGRSTRRRCGGTRLMPAVPRASSRAARGAAEARGARARSQAIRARPARARLRSRADASAVGAARRR